MSAGAGSDSTLDQMIPPDRWGTVHGIVPVDDGHGYRLTVLARDDNTAVNIGNRTAVMLNAGRSFSQTIDSGEYLLVESSQPVMVAQILHADQSNNETHSRPSSLIVPPVEQFQNFYPVVVPVKSAQDVTYLLLVMSAGQQDHLRVDGNAVPASTTWQPLTSHSGNHAYVGSMLAVDADRGRFVVETTSGAKFGVMVHGRVVGQCGFSYTAGQCLDVVTDADYAIMAPPAQPTAASGGACESNPCLLGGECTNDTATPSAYTCTCLVNDLNQQVFEGVNCQERTDIDLCSGAQCDECVQDYRVNGPLCLCEPGEESGRKHFICFCF